MRRPPLPPFTEDSARQKARLAEDGWNSRDPAGVALAPMPDSRWRDRVEFPVGRAEIEPVLQGRGFLAAAAVTIADIAGYSYIAHAPEGEGSLEAYPAIGAWLARIGAQPGCVGMAPSPLPEDS
ncbi:DUF1348 family protein [Acidimangrovimonas pyrenivorans]|uniref:DUF1348 family protein n=1 Tax=Acidimangrovimonas pyrenivorans TaxID=2030798 RepID=A0ABV7AHD8_9RHOB